MENYINEIWKKIDGYNDYYEASNYGRIRNIKTKRVLKPSVAKSSGYYHINLRQRGAKNGYITVQVHRLVASAFIPNTDNLDTVNHINFNKLDNRIDNLEWLSIGDNCRHYYNAKYPPKLKISIKNKRKSYNRIAIFLKHYFKVKRELCIEEYNIADNKLIENIKYLIDKGYYYKDGHVYSRLHKKCKQVKSNIVFIKTTRNKKTLSVAAHKFIFYYINGYLPRFVCHIDGNKLNNNISNLTDIYPLDKHKGYSMKNDRYCVRMSINNRDRFFGCYKKKDDAEYIYQKIVRIFKC